MIWNDSYMNIHSHMLNSALCLDTGWILTESIELAGQWWSQRNIQTYQVATITSLESGRLILGVILKMVFPGLENDDVYY